jgi:hypothetical protein
MVLNKTEFWVESIVKNNRIIQYITYTGDILNSSGARNIVHSVTHAIIATESINAA